MALPTAHLQKLAHSYITAAAGYKRVEVTRCSELYLGFGYAFAAALPLAQVVANVTVAGLTAGQ